MNNRPPVRRGLGRGLGSLIPTGPLATEPRDGGEDASASTAPPPRAHPTAHPSGPAADWIGRIPPPGPSSPPTDEAAGTRPDPQPDPGPDTQPGAQPDVQPHEPTGNDGTGLRPVEGASFAELPVDSIAPNSRQPRQVFDEDAMAELVHSIREVGLLQPVVVRRTGPDSYELVMGERRLRATREVGLTTIPAIVRQTGDDDLLRDALLENLHRAELNPLEEAAAYQQLLDDFGCTHDELASRIGRSRPQISNTLRLLKLSPAVQRRVAAGVLSAGHARTLLAVPDAAAQDRLATRVVAEGISVRGLEELVAVGELGEPGDQPPQRRARATPPELSEVTDRLSDLLDTRVKVEVGRSKGRIAIEFASIDDLHRIVRVIDGSTGAGDPSGGD